MVTAAKHFAPGHLKLVTITPQLLCQLSSSCPSTLPSVEGQCLKMSFFSLMSSISVAYMCMSIDRVLHCGGRPTHENMGELHIDMNNYIGISMKLLEN